MPNRPQSPEVSPASGSRLHIRVAIVEDEQDIRDSLCLLVNGTPGYTCTGGYRSMEKALEKIPRAVTDVVLSDIGLPGMNGIDGVRTLKQRFPDLLVLMLTVYDDDERILMRCARGRAATC